MGSSNKRNVRAEVVGFSYCWEALIGFVGSQIARLSSLAIVVLSGVLSRKFDINSSTVRHVLRGWVTHGDVTAVWMTQPLSSITISRLLETCREANVVGSTQSSTARQLFTGLLTALPFVKCRWICALLASLLRNV